MLPGHTGQRHARLDAQTNQFLLERMSVDTSPASPCNYELRHNYSTKKLVE